MKDDTTGTGSRSSSDEQVRQYLKILLLHLAAKYDNPGLELQSLLQEVIHELHGEVKASLRPNLKLI